MIQKIFFKCRRSKHKRLWDYLQQLLNDPLQNYNHIIRWKNRREGIFKIVDSANLAKLWGLRKNHPSMTYDKLSRSLRYYYKYNKLRKVPDERQVYQFLFTNANPPQLNPIMSVVVDELNNRIKTDLDSDIPEFQVKKEEL